MSDDTRKWCTYCRKSNHNDSECSCTRAIDWRPGPMFTFAAIPPVEPALRAKLDIIYRRLNQKGSP